jgi:hypothetical protein
MLQMFVAVWCDVTVRLYVIKRNFESDQIENIVSVLSTAVTNAVCLLKLYLVTTVHYINILVPSMMWRHSLPSLLFLCVAFMYEEMRAVL